MTSNDAGIFERAQTFHRALEQAKHELAEAKRSLEYELRMASIRGDMENVEAGQALMGSLSLQPSATWFQIIPPRGSRLERGRAESMSSEKDMKREKSMESDGIKEGSGSIWTWNGGDTLETARLVETVRDRPRRGESQCQEEVARND